ncbi:MAG: hypothetical protein KAR20_25425, partial [Candidatus Heimdallarchaeota archaeon]|nr:hypothetical protein [Candidatus Heimdallarchaeota archaeon]
MPDNWFYYIVLVILLIIMIVLGFFIGYYYQDNRDIMKQKVLKAEDKIKSLEANITKDRESHRLALKELTFYIDEFTRYKTELGENGIKAEELMDKYDDEIKRSNLRKSIVGKLIKWLQDNTSFSSPNTAEELGMEEDGEEIEEYRKIS